MISGNERFIQAIVQSDYFASFRFEYKLYAACDIFILSYLSYDKAKQIVLPTMIFGGMNNEGF